MVLIIALLLPKQTIPILNTAAIVNVDQCLQTMPERARPEKIMPQLPPKRNSCTQQRGTELSLKMCRNNQTSECPECLLDLAYRMDPAYAVEYRRGECGCREEKLSPL